MKPTDITNKDEWIQYLLNTIDEKDAQIHKLLEQMGKLLGKLYLEHQNRNSCKDTVQ